MGLRVRASESKLELSLSRSSDLFLYSLLFVSGRGLEGGPEGASSSILSSSKVFSEDEMSLEEEEKEVVSESDYSSLSFGSGGLGYWEVGKDSGDFARTVIPIIGGKDGWSDKVWDLEEDGGVVIESDLPTCCLFCFICLIFVEAVDLAE